MRFPTTGDRPEYSIEVKNLSKRFRYLHDAPNSIKTVLVDLLKGKLPLSGRKEFWALHDVSFKVKPGEFVGILGRNGAGKSTLLKLICGIYTPTLGTIETQGPISPLIELGAGFHPDLSGYENIFLNAAILGFGRQVTHEVLPQILEFSELGDMIHMPIKNYSSGMLVRLGFSVATHLVAPILLVDEVLAVGDAGFQRKSLAKIRELHNRGCTIILITHDYEAVRRECNRAILIEDHRIVLDGTPDAAAKEYLRLTLGES